MSTVAQRQVESEYLYPEKCSTALERWDKGVCLFTVEMGGLGPGYEQAIQVLVFEIIRDNLSVPLPDIAAMDETKRRDTWWNWADKTVSRCDESCGGFSGAQVGAAKNLAYRALRDGWGETIKSAPDDRRKQVSKFFPKAPEVKL